jgi:ubiquinone/menaquinone biosynthesis C-methylase UbiE
VIVKLKDHWESVYASKRDEELSWTQAEPRTSLSLISKVCPSGRVIDIGGGTSLLAERLLDRGYSVAVLDISETAIDRARQRLGARANQIRWIVADVTVAPSMFGTTARCSTFSSVQRTVQRTRRYWCERFRWAGMP